MNFIWFTWKDIKHPLAGGAEVVNEELARRLVADGHSVLFVVGGFKGGAQEEERDGFKIIRLGNRYFVYLQAYRYYRKNLVGWADLVIDEINTVPFFAKFYVKEKNILFVHQLSRVIWFYEMFFPLSLVGYLLEPLYLRLLSDRQVITVSESSRQDLLEHGFKKENISIISEGIKLAPVRELESYLPAGRQVKYEAPTILCLGAVRPMKRTLDIVEAFLIAKVNIPDLRFKISGDTSGKYGKKVLAKIHSSEYADAIEVLGRVSDEEKIELMKKSHVLAVASIKEGWGLVVTEAASQGTPAVVYNVDGLRDSVRHNETGLICKFNKPDYLALNIINILSDMANYERLRRNAWEWSREINFEKSYAEFLKFIKFIK